jgi:hypothetical protein
VNPYRTVRASKQQDVDEPPGRRTSIGESNRATRRIEARTALPPRREEDEERHMARGSVNFPALALASVVALGVTLGVPAAMEHHATAPDVLASAQARMLVAAPHTDGNAGAVAAAPAGTAPVLAAASTVDVDGVAIAPGTIRIEVVAQRRPIARWWSALMHDSTT